MATSAGILFTYRNRALIGQKRNGYWSGIGGKLEKNETPRIAAVRESLEEIFGVFDENFARELSPEIRLRHVYDNAGFVMYQASLSILGEMVNAIRAKNIPARNYPNGLPNDISELVEFFVPRGEIKALAILDKTNARSFKLDRYFRQDLIQVGIL